MYTKNENYKLDISNKTIIYTLYSYTRPYFKKIILGFMCMLMVVGTSAALAKIMKPIINEIFLNKQDDMLLPITIAIFAIFLVKGLCGYGQAVSMAFVGYKVIADIQKDFFNKLMNMDLKFYYKISSGDLVSRFINDTNKLNGAVSDTISSIGKDFLTLIAFLVIMIQEDAKLFGLICFIFPIAVLPVVKIGHKIRKNVTYVQEYTSDLNTLLGQCLRGIRLVKSYCLEQYEQKNIAQAIEAIFIKTLKTVRTKSINHPAMEFLAGIAIAGVIFYGGTQVIAGAQTPGAFFAFITAFLLSYEPMKRLANMYSQLQEQLAAGKRVFTILSYESDYSVNKLLPDLNIVKGAIKFKNVNFAYQKDKLVLKNININIESGKKIALVGASGSGKTTLINLLLRFFEINEGSISIDNYNIKDVNIQSLRQSIALISQEVVLFDDTVAANIKFGNINATLQQVQQAAKQAAADEFINDLPYGYDSYVGEHGVNLSGGQRQRIAIARAFLKNSRILLMDEPTSALDSNSEMKIKTALTKLMQGRTTITIAHKLSTVHDMDIIYVIDRGQIVSAGTHKELKTNCAIYSHLSAMQIYNNND